MVEGRKPCEREREREREREEGREGEPSGCERSTGLGVKAERGRGATQRRRGTCAETRSSSSRRKRRRRWRRRRRRRPPLTFLPLHFLPDALISPRTELVVRGPRVCGGLEPTVSVDTGAETIAWCWRRWRRRWRRHAVVWRS